MVVLAPSTEIALHLAFELARVNNSRHLFNPFLSFVYLHEKEFISDYEGASHLRRHSTGHLEKKLVTFLIQMSAFHCTHFNCHIASNIMVLLGYESYQLRRHRFRQKVENYLRQQRREGGSVPPSTRTGVTLKTQFSDPLKGPTLFSSDNDLYDGVRYAEMDSLTSKGGKQYRKSDSRFDSGCLVTSADKDADYVEEGVTIPQLAL